MMMGHGYGALLVHSHGCDSVRENSGTRRKRQMPGTVTEGKSTSRNNYSQANPHV